MMEQWLKNYKEWDDNGSTMVTYLTDFKNFFSNNTCKFSIKDGCKKNIPDRKIINNTLIETCSKCNLNRSIKIPSYIKVSEYKSKIRNDIQNLESKFYNILLDLNTGNISDTNPILEFNTLKNIYKETKLIDDNINKYMNNSQCNSELKQKKNDLDKQIKEIYNLIEILNMNNFKFKELYLNKDFSDLKIPENKYNDIDYCKLFIVKKNYDLKSTKTVVAAKKYLTNKMFEKKEEKSEIDISLKKKNLLILELPSTKDNIDDNIEIINKVKKKKEIKKKKTEDEKNLNGSKTEIIPKHILLTDNARDNLKAVAEKKDIKVGKIFSKSVDLLVASDIDPKNKKKKALEKNINIINNSNFINKFS